MLGVLLFSACAPLGPRVLTPQQLASLGSRTVDAPFDEAFDAAWLVLEGAGWAVETSDRRAGTLKTNVVVLGDGVGRAWDASVALDGAALRITLLPRLFANAQEITAEMHWTLDGPRGEQAKWDDLFGRIEALLAAWRTHPELVLDRARAEIDAGGLRLLLPGWKHCAFSVDRRTLTVTADGPVPVPAFMLRVERRVPRPDPDAFLHEALEKAAKGRLVVAENAWTVTVPPWADGEVRVGQDLAPVGVRWRAWDAVSPTWVVRVVAVCPDGADGCSAEVEAALETAVNTSAAVPGFKTR